MIRHSILLVLLLTFCGSAFTISSAASNPVSTCQEALLPSQNRKETHAWLLEKLGSSGLGDAARPILSKTALSDREALVLSLLALAQNSSETNARGWFEYLQSGIIPSSQVINGQTFISALSMEGRFELQTTPRVLGIEPFEALYGKRAALVSISDHYLFFDGSFVSDPLQSFIHDLGHALAVYETFWKEGEGGPVKESMFARWVDAFWRRVGHLKKRSVDQGDYLRAMGFDLFRDRPSLWDGLRTEDARPFLKFLHSLPHYCDLPRRLKNDQRDLGKNFPNLSRLSNEELGRLERIATREFADVFLTWIRDEGGLARVTRYFPVFRPREGTKRTTPYIESLIRDEDQILGNNALGKRLKKLEREIFGSR